MSRPAGQLVGPEAERDSRQQCSRQSFSKSWGKTHAASPSPWSCGPHVTVSGLIFSLGAASSARLQSSMPMFSCGKRGAAGNSGRSLAVSALGAGRAGIKSTPTHAAGQA